MKTILCLAFVVLAISGLQAQDKYMTRNAKIRFVSEAPLEKIESINSQGASVLDTKTGQIEFSVLMKSFEFEKALMGEHFQEKYVESDKFPKSTFKGTVTDIASVNFGKDGSYPVIYKGSFTLHGVTKDVTGKGSMDIKGGKLIAKSNFNLPIEEYKIEIPSVVKDKIAKEVQVTVDAAYEKLEKK